MLFLRDDLLLFTFRVGARKKERGVGERIVSESASAFAREGTENRERERELMFVVVQFVSPPRGT